MATRNILLLAAELLPYPTLVHSFCVLRITMWMEFNQKRKAYNNNELRYCCKGKTYCIRSSSARRMSEHCYLLLKISGKHNVGREGTVLIHDLKKRIRPYLSETCFLHLLVEKKRKKKYGKINEKVKRKKLRQR